MWPFNHILHSEFISFIETLEKTSGPHQKDLELLTTVKTNNIFLTKKVSSTLNKARLAIEGKAKKSSPLYKTLKTEQAELAYVTYLVEIKEEVAPVIELISTYKGSAKYNSFTQSATHLLRAAMTMSFLQPPLTEKKIKPALEEINATLNINPNYAPAYILRAAIYLYSNWLEIGKQDCLKAIHLDPTYELAFTVFQQINFAQNADKMITVPPLELVEYPYPGYFKELKAIFEAKIKDPVNTSAASIQENQIGYTLANALVTLVNYAENFEGKKAAKKSQKISALNSIKIALVPAIAKLLEAPSEENKQAVIKILHSQDIVLSKDKKYSKIAKNIALVAALLGIGYVIAGLVNLAITRGKHFAFFTPKSIQKIEAVEKQVVDFYKNKKPK